MILYYVVLLSRNKYKFYKDHYFDTVNEMIFPIKDFIQYYERQ